MSFVLPSQFLLVRKEERTITVTTVDEHCIDMNVVEEFDAFCVSAEDVIKSIPNYTESLRDTESAIDTFNKTGKVALCLKPHPEAYYKSLVVSPIKGT